MSSVWLAVLGCEPTDQRSFPAVGLSGRTTNGASMCGIRTPSPGGFRPQRVAMSVDDLPFAVLAPVDVRDPQDDRADGAAVEGHRGPLEPDRVGEIPADPRREQLELVLAAVGEPRGDRPERVADLVPATGACRSVGAEE